MIVHKHTKGRLPSVPLPSRQFLTKIAQAVFSSEKSSPPEEINVVFVDNPEIRRLNKKFLDEKGETDVIAFGYETGSDIFISVPVAVSNARRYEDSPKRELTRLVVHGLLHVLGYSDHKPGPKKIMWKKQEQLVGRLHKNRP